MVARVYKHHRIGNKHRRATDQLKIESNRSKFIKKQELYDWKVWRLIFFLSTN